MAQEASEMAGRTMSAEGEFVWTEIASNDADKCQAFYENVFGWTFKKGQADPAMATANIRPRAASGLPAVFIS